MERLLRLLFDELVMSNIRLQVLRIFVVALLLALMLIAGALWLGSLTRDGALVQVDTLVTRHETDQQPVFQLVLPSGAVSEATFAEPVDSDDYPVGTSHRLRYDPENPVQLQMLAPRWPLYLAWLIGLPGVLLLTVTLLLGRLVLRMLRQSGPK